MSSDKVTDRLVLFTESLFMQWLFYVCVFGRNKKKKINGSLCCLGYPSEIWGDRRDRILITSSMYCNFRRRIKGFFSAWEERVCGSMHKVRYNSWILIATANSVTICMTTDTVSFKDLCFPSTMASETPTTPKNICAHVHTHTHTLELTLPLFLKATPTQTH